MLHGLYTGWLTLPRGVMGRTLLGRQCLRALGTPPSGSDSVKTRLSPNASDGDVYIASVQVAPGNYAFQLNQDGTYDYNARGDSTRQLATIDGISLTFGTLYGEGAMTINDDPPQPAGGPGATFFPNVVYTLGQVVNLQLEAVDPQNDTVTFTVTSGGVPGLSMSTSGLVTGLTTTAGIFGIVTKIADPFGAFTLVTDTITVTNNLPSFLGQLLAQASVSAVALGLIVADNTTPSILPLNTIISQVPAAGQPLVVGSTITFTVSDASLSIGNPNMFPNNILGLTWAGARTHIWKSIVQTSITGKTSSLAYMQYPLVEWDLNYELLNQAAALDDLKKIEGLFNQVQGSTQTFQYQDPSFNAVVAQAFGTGDGATKSFQLVAANANAAGPGAVEIVQAVDFTTAAPQIFINGALQTGTYTIGPTGIVNFTSAPASGTALTWTGAFLYNCRFQVDDLDPNQFMSQFWSLQSIKFRSVVL